MTAPVEIDESRTPHRDGSLYSLERILAERSRPATKTMRRTATRSAQAWARRGRSRRAGCAQRFAVCGGSGDGTALRTAGTVCR